MRHRENAEWLADLQPGAPGEAAALADLRALLLGAVTRFLSQPERQAGAGPDARHLAEDCAQEAVILVRASLDKFRGESRFTTWAYSIAIRVALGELRRRRWRQATIEQAQLGEAIPAWPIEPPGPERTLEQQQAWALLSELIETALTPLQRKALVAHAFQGMPLDLVAEWLGGTRNSIYKLIHDARKRLKAALLARGVTHSDIVATFDPSKDENYFSRGGKTARVQNVS